MFKLTERNSDIYNWEGVNIELNLSFDNVLVFLEMFGDDSVPFNDRLLTALDMLVCDVDILPIIAEHGKLLDFSLDMLRDKLNLRLRDEDQTVSTDTNSKEDEGLEPVPVYDWNEDAGYIYSSFLFDYGIDLIEQQGKLTWDRFTILFNNISAESKMGEALHYRSCEVPKKEKGNEDERKRIIRMKEYYALKVAQPIIERNQLIMYEREMKARRERMNKGR